MAIVFFYLAISWYCAFYWNPFTMTGLQKCYHLYQMYDGGFPSFDIVL